MIKKVLSIIMIAALLFQLVACGNSSTSISTPVADSSHPDAFEDFDDGYSQTEAPPSAETVEQEQEELLLSLEEIMNDVLQYAEDADMEISQDADTIVSVMYISGEFTDAYSIFEYLCSEGWCIPKSSAANGIVVAKIVPGQPRMWDSTGTFHSIPFTLYLDVINPDTGEVSNFKTFSSMETHSCSAGFYSAIGASIGSNTSVTRNYFNSDFTKMIATLTMENGAVHVGWIDGNGQFTDVSAKISHSSEFSGLINHQKPCFYNDYLYFMDFTNDNVQIKRVPIDSLFETSVDILVDDVKYKRSEIYPYPDGSVGDNAAREEFSDASMTYVADCNFFNDWISVSEFVGSDNGMIYKYILSPKDTYHNFAWYDERIALVPEIKGRTNWGAVVSPDGNKVAFLSKLTSGTDTSTSLFIVSIDGGEPTKVNTIYDLNNSDKYASTVTLFNWE